MGNGFVPVVIQTEINSLLPVSKNDIEQQADSGDDDSKDSH